MSKKNELKNGTIVKLRNGKICIIGKEVANFQSKEWSHSTYSDYKSELNSLVDIGNGERVSHLDNYRDDLTNKHDNKYDIIAYSNNFWEWERPKEILTVKEKEYLSAVIKPFRNSVMGLVKRPVKLLEKEYIKIHISYDPDAQLPYFQAGTMYKGMEDYKEYTIEELKL